MPHSTSEFFDSLTSIPARLNYRTGSSDSDTADPSDMLQTSFPRNTFSPGVSGFYK